MRNQDLKRRTRRFVRKRNEECERGNIRHPRHEQVYRGKHHLQAQRQQHYSMERNNQQEKSTTR